MRKATTTAGLVGICMLVGCAHQRPSSEGHLQRARAELYRRDAAVRALVWQNVALRASLAEYQQRVQRLVDAEAHAKKLEESAALNREFEQRLMAAEEALERLVDGVVEQSEAAEEGPAASPLPSALSLAERTLQDLKEGRMKAQERAAALRALTTNVQHMIDSGQLRIIHDQGRAKLLPPRPLDTSDPW